MSSDVVPEPHNLAKKPLAEAIFELRWALRKGSGPVEEDPGFRILVGRYYDRIRNDYRTAVDLPVSQVPESMTPYAVRHQFRAAPDQWPVTQIGPGVVTFNETTAYDWKPFREKVSRIVQSLFDAYPTDISALTPTQVTLRYMNAVLFDPSTSDRPILTFIKDFLHASILVDPLLFDEPEQANSPTNVLLNLTYAINKVQGIGSLLFVKGEQEGKPAIIWEINIRTKDEYCPTSPNDIDEWLGKAHEVAEKWFFTLCRGTLLKSFEGADEKRNA